MGEYNVKMLPSKDSQFAVIPVTINTSLATYDAPYEESFAVHLREMEGLYPKWNILPTEECDRLKSTNFTLWLLLDEHSNSTVGEPICCLEHAPTLDLSNTVQAITLSILFLLSLIGNLLTVYSISTKQKSSRQYSSSIYHLIFHLSIADLLVTITCLFGEAAWSYSVSWLADNFTCKVFKFVQVFSLYLSTFVLVLVGLDRFLAVRYPMKSLSTKRRCNRLIVTVWVLSLFLSSPQLLIFRVKKGPFYEEFYQCVTYGFYTELWQEQLYTITSLFLMFILPLSVIVWAYVSTFVTLAKSEKMFLAEIESGNFLPTDVNRRRLMHRAKTKSMRISVVIVVAFVICWTPYYFMMILFMFWEPGEQLERNLRSGIFCFGMSNSLVNPIIYGAFHLWRPKHQRRYTCSSRDFNHFSVRTSNRRKVNRSEIETEANFIETLHEETCSIMSFHEEGSQQSGKLTNSRLAAKIILRYKGVFSPPSQIHL